MKVFFHHKGTKTRRTTKAILSGIGGAAALLIGCSEKLSERTVEKPVPVAQGRAGGEESSAKGFKLALPGRAYSFPRDHASHPEYATEWWYYTGGLRDGDGRTYGYQLTFFRIGVTPPTVKRASDWAVRNLYFAHLAVTDDRGQAHYFAERVDRGSMGTAGAAADKYRVHIGAWSARLSGNTHVLAASDGRFGVSLRAIPTKPPAIHGENGVSQKAAGIGRASHYYSLTRMTTRGTITVAGTTHSVEGQTWFDHEFGSNVLAENQVGWDWFSLQMDDGSEVMLFLMRTRDEGTDPYSSGTLIAPDGTTIHLRREDFEIETQSRWKSPETGATYPAKWRIRVPAAALDVTVEPTVAAQEMRTETMGTVYWEGRVTLRGTRAGKPVTGQGYAELTGYAGAFRQTF